MFGTLVNVAAIVAGGLLGTWMRRGIPERYNRTLMQGLGLCIFLVGLSGALKTENILAVILSVVFGSLTGELLRLDERLDQLGAFLERRFAKGEGTLAKGFIMGTLVFCVGAMSIVGAMESGLLGQHQTLYTKSLIDGILAILFGSTLGAGVAVSGVVVLIYQGLLTLMAVAIRPFLTQEVILEISAVGGLLIVGVGLNILEIKKINVANLLPAILMPVAYAILASGLAKILAFF